MKNVFVWLIEDGGSSRRLQEVFNFHLVISSVLRKYRSIHSSYCCWLPTLGCIAWSSFHWVHWNVNHIHLHVTYRCCNTPGTGDNVGDLMEKCPNRWGNCTRRLQRPHICPGSPSRGSRWHVHYKFCTVICWLYVCCYNYENKFIT